MRFSRDIAENEELRLKLDEIAKRLFEDKQVESDLEALVKAAAELGYDLSAGEIERLRAEAQELSEEELESVAGGWTEPEDKWCVIDYYCYGVLKQEDAEGEEGRKDKACWHDYSCIIGYHI